MKIIDMKKTYLLFSVLISLWLTIFSYQISGAENTTITFPSMDGLEITADTYITNDQNAPLIILFHQAGWSRGEYLEIAPKLNKLGFNCIAIDQRSGKTINGIDNETASRASKAEKQIRYIDALPDIEAALHYARSQFSDSKIIAWGSSYSAALVLQLAGSQPDLVDGVLSFAPGEYFAKHGKSKSWIKDSAININIPVFITSARNEKNSWSAIYSAIKSEQKTSFVPDTKGNHGSRALWDQFEDSYQCWKVVNEFLTNNFL
jgi:dienelactone hydrolase